MAYKVDYIDVPIPELDAFFDDLRAVFRKHGATLALIDELLVIERFDETDDLRSWVNIESSDRKIPWIEAAFQKANEIRAAEAAERCMQQNEARRAANAELERKLVEAGITLASGHYRLVKD